MKQKSVKRLIGELAEWVKRPRNREFLLDGASADLRDYLAGNLEAPEARLSRVSYWLGNLGAFRVLSNDSSGWSDIQRSSHYQAWNERVLLANLAIGKARSISIVTPVFVLLHAMAYGETKMASWVGNRLISGMQRNEKGLGGWAMGPLYPFALRLFAKWRQLPFPAVTPEMSDMGIYEDVLNAWKNDADFAKALVAACDYHVQQAFDDAEHDTMEFFRPLYREFPVEILAIGRVRADEGLPMPAIDHPLMQTPLANPPAKIPLERDELLEAVCAKVRKDFSFDDPWS